MAALAPLKRLGRGLALWAAGDFLGLTYGGTGSTTAAGARSNLGAAASGANSDITSLTGLSTLTTSSNATIGGVLSVAGAVYTGSALYANDRNGNGHSAALYRNNDTTRLWDNAYGDTIIYDTAGNVSIPGTLSLGSPLAIASGGTGSTTASGALLKILGAQAPAAPTTATTLSVTDIERDVYATGTITITMPNGGAGWRSGVLVNDNPQAGVVTIAVPSGATLDGVVNGTTVLYPYQRARIRQTGATTYRTDWVERSPLVAALNITTAVVSADIALPVGYGRFNVLLSGLSVSSAGATVFARIGDAAGVKAGANDYTNTRSVAYGTSTSVGTSYDTYFNLAVGVSNGFMRPLTRLLISPGSGGADVPAIMAQTVEGDTGSNLDVISLGGFYNGTTSGVISGRASLLRIGVSAGTMIANVSVRGEP